jgi:hypothetical protein
MKKLLFASFFFLTAIFVANAQYPAANASFFQKKNQLNSEFSDTNRVAIAPVENVWDHLTIISDSRIDTLLQIHREENLRKNGMDGYQVQIFQGSKDDAYKIKAKFLASHPASKAYVTFQSPDFRVRVGDFRTRSEALKMKNQIKNEFNNPFIVEGVISFPELSKD